MYAPFRALKDGIQFVYQMDTALTDLSKVVDFSSNQLNEMADASINLGKQLGKSSVEIMQGMAEFGRITKDQNEIIELTRVATMASNVTTMTSAEAAKAITTSMITFGIEAKDSMKILNSLNEVQNNFRISAEDMVASISKIGAASRLANTDMEDLEGMTTAIVQSLGISGNEAGTAIKSFMSRIYRTDESNPDELGKTAKVLKEIMNIDTTDANDNLKSFNSLISEIKSGWSEMSKQEQLAVSQSMGSTYHYSKFIALMEAYQIKLDAATMARNSENSALEENAKKLDSISGRLGLLKVASEEFWASIINSSSLKTMVSSLTYLVSTFANLSTILVLIASGFAIFKGTAIIKFFSTASFSAMLLKSSLVQTQMALINLSEAEILATTTTERLIFAMKGLGVAIKANPIGLIITSIFAVVMAMDIYNQKQEEAAQKQKESIDIYKSQQNEISSLIETYRQNAELAKTDDNAKKQLIETEKKLKDVFGETAQSLDLQSGSIDDNIAKLEKLDLANQTAFRDKQKAFAEDAKNSLNTPNQYSAGGLAEQDFYGTPEAALEYYENLRNEINKNLHKATSFGGENSTDTIEESKQISAMIDTLSEKVKVYKTSILTLDDAYKMVAQSSIEGLDKLSEKQKTVFDNIKGKLTFTNEDQYKKNLLEVMDILSKFDGKNIDETNSKLHKIDASLPPISDNANKSKNTVDSFTKSLTTLQETLSSSASSISEIQSALTEYNDAGSFSLDTLIKLADKLESLLPILGDEKAVHQELTNIIQQEQEKSEQAYITMINGSTDFYNANIEGIKNLVEGLGLQRDEDLKGAKDLASAKLLVELALIKKLATLWSSYYDTNTGAFTGEVEQIGSRQVVTGGSNHESTYVSDEMTTQMSALARAERIAKEKFDNIVLDNSGIDFSKIGMSGSKSSSKDSSKDSSSDSSQSLQIEDLTQALITQINAEHLLQKAKSDSIQKDLSQAQSQKDYQKTLSLTNSLISSQAEELSLLNSAHDSINSLSDSNLQSSSSSQFGDINKWFTGSDNQESVAYVKAHNEASEETRKIMDELFKSQQLVRNAWVANSIAIKDNIDAQKTLKNSLIQIEIDKFEQSMAKLDAKMNLSKSIMDLYDKSSEEYSKEQARQVTLLKEKEDAIFNEIVAIGHLLKATDLTTEAQKTLNDEMANLKLTLNQNQKSMQDYANDIVQILKDAAKIRKTIDLAVIDVEMRSEDRRHQQVLDDIDSEEKAREDSINKQISAIDRLANAENYTKDLNSAQTDAQTLQSQIDALSLDTSNEGKSRTAELQKQLLEKQSSIDDMQNSHATDLRKQNLQDALDAIKKESEAKKKSENEAYEAKKQSLEDQKTATETAFNELMLNDEIWSAKVQEILDGNITGIQDSLNTFADEFTTTLTTQAGKIDTSFQAIINTIKQIKSAANELDAFPNYASGTSFHKGGLAKTSEEGRELIIPPNSKPFLSGNNGPEIMNLEKGTEVIPHNLTESILAKSKLLNIPSYANGIGITSSIMDLIKNIQLPSFNLPQFQTPQFANNSSSGTNVTIPNINFNVTSTDGIISKKNLEIASNYVIRQIERAQIIRGR